MGKHSKRNRRRMQQSGMGGRFSVAYARPKVVRRRTKVSALSERARFRLRCVEYSHSAGVVAAMEAFAISRSTVSRWRARFNADDLSTFENRSRRPTRTRRQQWSAAQEQAVLGLREAHPRFGKMKLQQLVRAEGILLSASTIGRILASLKRRHILIEPVFQPTRQRGATRPYATRVPKDKRKPTTPGEMIQLDTMHLRPLPSVERRQFTAIDVVSKCAVIGVRGRATARTAADFLDELVARMPFPVQAIQVDGGSEFMAGFEAACKTRDIPLYVLPPRSPKLNGCVERLTAPCAGSSGSVMAGISTCRPFDRRCGTGRRRTLRGDHTRHSGTRPRTARSLLLMSHMYRTSTWSCRCAYVRLRSAQAPASTAILGSCALQRNCSGGLAALQFR